MLRQHEEDEQKGEMWIFKKILKDF